MVRKYNFSPEQKQEIVDLYVSGQSAAQIRDAYGVKSESSLYAILHEYKVPLHTRKPGFTSKSQRNHVEVATEEDLPVDERLPQELPTEKNPKKRYRVTLKVRLTFEADSIEGAVAKSKGYNGFQEVLSVSRIA